MKRFLPVLFGLLWISAAAVSVLAEERILSYDSEITVAADGSMTVVETIRVRAEGRNIRRGIYRDFPTDYKDQYGNHYKVMFDVLGVSRDGGSESFRTERRSNGVRVYAGRSDVILQPGEYTYRIRYRTDRQLGFFDDHDELYWNVTGNGWVFPIERASATVILPEGIPDASISMEGYTGVYGRTSQDVVSRVVNGRAIVETTRGLAGGEGLTLVAGWPKGFVDEPGPLDRLGYLLKDNLGLLLALSALALSAWYLYFVWSKFGRDPEAGVVFPHYEPPKGFSPASARFISRMSYDAKTLTAAVINLAVKGFIEIDKTGEDYVLTQKSSDEPLAPGEKVLYAKLFAGGPVLELDNKNHKEILLAKAHHNAALRRNYEKIYFLTNTPLLLPSFLLSVVVAIGIAVADLGVPVVIAVFVVNFLLHGVFYYLMRAPTQKGRRLLDKLEGFRLYLDVAEKEALNLRNPPEKTPELFERYLPFALALGVEQAWAAQFAGVFAALSAQGEDYQPRWYRGSFNSMRLGNFASSVGSSLNSAISSAATAPGSSSGGGGGGFSGGGGGGGGGGGW